jgi:hypothetical protein
MGVKKDKLLSSHKARSERIRESLNRLAAGLKKTFHDQEVGGFFTAPEPNQTKKKRTKRREITEAMSAKRKQAKLKKIKSKIGKRNPSLCSAKHSSSLLFLLLSVV